MEESYVKGIFKSQETANSVYKINVDDLNKCTVDLENYFVINDNNTVYYTTDIKTCIVLFVETDKENLLCHLSADESGFSENGIEVLSNLIFKYSLSINKISIFYGYRTSDVTVKSLFKLLENRISKDFLKEENIAYLDTTFGIRDDVEGSVALYNNCIYGYDKDERTITPFIKGKNNLSRIYVK